MDKYDVLGFHAKNYGKVSYSTPLEDLVEPGTVVPGDHERLRWERVQRHWATKHPTFAGLTLGEWAAKYRMREEGIREMLERELYGTERE